VSKEDIAAAWVSVGKSTTVAPATHNTRNDKKGIGQEPA
jgi:hypothetical protein